MCILHLTEGKFALLKDHVPSVLQLLQTSFHVTAIPDPATPSQKQAGSMDTILEGLETSTAADTPLMGLALEGSLPGVLEVATYSSVEHAISGTSYGDLADSFSEEQRAALASVAKMFPEAPASYFIQNEYAEARFALWKVGSCHVGVLTTLLE